RFTGNGSIAPGWDSGAFPVCTLDNQELPSGIAPDGSGGAYIVWRQDRSSPYNDHFARAQHVLANGQLASGWPWNGLQTSVGSHGAPGRPPTVAANGRGGARLGFQGGPYTVQSARLDFAES